MSLMLAGFVTGVATTLGLALVLSFAHNGLED